MRHRRVGRASRDGRDGGGFAAYRRGDFGAARAEFRPLAEAGDARAQYALGLMHADGKGGATDPRAAARWFERAALAGFARAQYQLALRRAAGVGIPFDLVQAYVWFTLAHRNGFDRAAAHRDWLGARLSAPDRAAAEARLRSWESGDRSDRHFCALTC